MYPKDYIELCRLIGQDAIVLEAIWTPLKQVRPDGAVGPITDRSIKTRADLNRVIWPGEPEIEERLQYVREYVAAARAKSTKAATRVGCEKGELKWRRQLGYPTWGPMWRSAKSYPGKYGKVMP